MSIVQKEVFLLFFCSKVSPPLVVGEDGKGEYAKISFLYLNPFLCIKLDLSWANCKFIQSPHVVSSHNFSGYNYNVPTTSGPQVLSLEELTWDLSCVRFQLELEEKIELSMVNGRSSLQRLSMRQLYRIITEKRSFSRHTLDLVKIMCADYVCNFKTLPMQLKQIDAT